VAGDLACDSYDASHWAGFSPIRILGVTFGDGSAPKQFAAVSDLGGKAEVLQTCPTFGGPFCIYPWYTLGTTGFHYGVDYPDTRKDFGQSDQFAQTTLCGGSVRSRFHLLHDRPALNARGCIGSARR